MRGAFTRLLDSPRTVHAAAALSLALGLFFLFVWTPLPWGWEGIDHYHDRAIRLAGGAPFDTTDVPWGYAYFLAAFYAIFGAHPWVPLVAQALLNALVPILLFRLAQPLAGTRAAALAAVLAGAFSFNTVYVSTQSSDCVSTVLFLAALLQFSRGVRDDRWWPFIASGLFAGLAAQFRPNLILFPPLAAGVFVLARRFGRAAWMRAAVYLAMTALVLLPWIVRNYRLTEMFMPTSTHGGVQLWYGTLQVGPYLESRAHNPRSAFESPAFDYTSIAGLPLVVSADYSPCRPGGGDTLALVYWTDRDAEPRRVPAGAVEGETRFFEVPGQPAPTTLYYYFEASYPAGERGPAARFTVPAGGADDPRVAFVAADHLGDLDQHEDLLDVFDIIRLTRHLAWNEPVTGTRTLDLSPDGRLDERDLAAAVALLVPEVLKAGAPEPAVVLERGADAAVIRLPLGASLSIPRESSVRQTDVLPQGELAAALVSRWRTYSSIPAPGRPLPRVECLFVDRIRVNDVFYRREPHMMGRYTALAFDNIARDPAGFAAAAAYRMVRLFIIRGTGDQATTQQFAGAGLAYGAGFALSAAYFAVFLAGAVVAVRRRSPVLWLLVPIAYVPATISVVLTNMRYTITVQPLMFVFVAVAVVAALGLDSPGGERARDVREGAEM